MKKTQSKALLLISFQNISEETKQKVLELALETLAFPYSSSDDNSLIFEFQSLESEKDFIQKIKNLKLPINNFVFFTRQ